MAQLPAELYSCLEPTFSPEIEKVLNTPSPSASPLSVLTAFTTQTMPQFVNDQPSRQAPAFQRDNDHL